MTVRAANPASSEALTIDRATAIAPRIMAPGLISRVKNWTPGTVIVILLVLACIDLEIYPAKLFEWSEIAGKMIAGFFRPVPPADFETLAEAMAETFAMGIAGTFLAVVLATPLGFIGSKTIISNRMAHGLIRFTFNVLRAIPVFIFAVILIRAFGLGPMVGVIAIGVAESPYIAKLYAEIIENADRRPMIAMRAAGSGPLQAIRFGLAPQILPNFLGIALFFLEINMRAAAALGIFGAGGIGKMLHERIGFAAFDEAAFILLLLLVMVATVDLCSGYLRQKLVGTRSVQWM